jgi:hypothetical protein
MDGTEKATQHEWVNPRIRHPSRKPRRLFLGDTAFGPAGGSVDADGTRKGEEISANARKLNWIAHGVCPGTRGHVLENEHKERQRDDQVALSAHKHLPSWAAA